MKINTNNQTGYKEKQRNGSQDRGNPMEGAQAPTHHGVHSVLNSMG